VRSQRARKNQRLIGTDRIQRPQRITLRTIAASVLDSQTEPSDNSHPISAPTSRPIPRSGRTKAPCAHQGHPYTGNGISRIKPNETCIRSGHPNYDRFYFDHEFRAVFVLLHPF